MRIIAGTARSMPLKTVEGKEIRPTTDRIKETLFNILQKDVPGCRFLDLFAGSGQIGLEALSRGAETAVFVDSGRKAAACIEENIRFTKFEDRSRLLTMDALSALGTLEGRDSFDIVFLDPPYRSGAERGVLEYLSHSSLLKPDSLVIVEAALDTDYSYAAGYGFRILREKTYKTNKHMFFAKEDDVS